MSYILDSISVSDSREPNLWHKYLGLQENVLIHTVEYYSALKRKEILTRATLWMNFENIILSEISQSQKDKYCMIPLIWGNLSSQIYNQKVECCLPGTGGKEVETF